jgi:hypothetical protein
VTRVARHLLLLAAFAALAVPGVASASPRQVLNDCNDDGALSRQYSTNDLRKALDNMPTDLAEYSDCEEIIGAAISGGSDKGQGRGSPGQGVGGAGAADPGEQAARAQDAADLEAITSGDSDERRKPTIQVGDQSVQPGGSGLYDLSSASNQLPTPLLIALIALGLLALAGGFVALRGRVPALGRVPLLSKIPTPRVPFTKQR